MGVVRTVAPSLSSPCRPSPRHARAQRIPCSRINQEGRSCATDTPPITAATQTDLTRAFQRIARPSGALAMIAIDQRESLRSIFQERTGARVDDQALVDFKLAVVHRLSPTASAVLVDRLYGLHPVLEADALSPGCGLIVAADDLVQEPGGPVQDTSLDPDVDLHRVRELGAAALKLLVIWYADGAARRRQSLVAGFLERCRQAGLLGIVEPVVRPPRGANGQAWDRDAAILEAAREVGAYGPDLYKGEVPLFGRGDPEVIRRRCAEMTAVLPCPWVVLSSGVQPDNFPAAVEAACRGGASGFLAGRAIWADTIGPEGYLNGLSSLALPRLETLTAIVDRTARPWTDAIRPQRIKEGS